MEVFNAFLHIFNNNHPISSLKSITIELGMVADTHNIIIGKLWEKNFYKFKVNLENQVSSCLNKTKTSTKQTKINIIGIFEWYNTYLVYLRPWVWSLDKNNINKTFTTFTVDMHTKTKQNKIQKNKINKGKELHPWKFKAPKMLNHPISSILIINVGKWSPSQINIQVQVKTNKNIS